MAGSTKSVHKTPRRLWALGLALAVACGVVPRFAVVAARSPSDDSARSHQAIRQLPALVQQGVDHPYVRAFGLNPDRATLVAALANGVTVAKIGDDSAVCLVISDGDDQCFGTSAIRDGRGYAITNDCSKGAGRSMRIVGVPPKEATRVTVRYSSGPALAASADGGAFTIQTTTPPVASGRFPVAIDYLNTSASVVASDAIHGGNDLCLRRASS
jgi:hypothetical protein